MENALNKNGVIFHVARKFQIPFRSLRSSYLILVLTLRGRWPAEISNCQIFLNTNLKSRE